MRSKTTSNLLGIDMPTHLPDPPADFGGFGYTVERVGAPTFSATLQFLVSTIAIFLATAAVSYLVLQTRTRALRLYRGAAGPPAASPEQDKRSALAAARCVTLAHVLTVAVLVIRTRQALMSVAPCAYEVCTLILGVEAAVSVMVGGFWVVVKAAEQVPGR